MQAQVSEITPVLVEVKIEVPWDRVQKQLDQSFAELARTAKVRGFRPGKVPRNVVRQLFGRQVKGEVAATLIEEALLEAVQQHSLQVVAQPQVDVGEIVDSTPFAFTAKVEVRPKIDKVDTSRIVVYKPKTEVENGDVDAAIDRLREQHAELRVPEPMRPSKEGDQLVIDYQVEIDGEAREDMAASDRPVELGADRLIPEFEQGLRGVQPGETKDVVVTFADDHGNEELRGKSATFHVQVKELREKILPEADDEFAKDLGEHETLLELRLAVRKDLEKEAEARAEAALKEQLVDKLVETNEIPVPPSMVQEQERQLMYEFATFLQMTGQDLPMTQELHGRMHVRAERRVKAALLLGALARQEGVELGPEDVEKRLAEIAERTGKHIAKIRVEYQGERREALESQIVEEKLMAILRERAEIREGEPPAEPAVAEESAAVADEAKAEASAEGEPKKKKATKAKAAKKPASSKKKKEASEEEGGEG